MKKYLSIFLPIVLAFNFFSYAANSATPKPRIAVNCSTPLVPVVNFPYSKLIWRPLVNVAYSGKNATVVIRTRGATTTITLNRSANQVKYRAESVSYEANFDNFDFNYGTQLVTFQIIDSSKQKSTTSCPVTLAEGSFPSPLTSTNFVIPGVQNSLTGKILGCRFKGIYLSGNVYISQDLTADFRINKTDSPSGADISVRITKYPAACGEWNIVTSPALADFSVYLSSNNWYSDFQIYTGN